MTKAAEVRLLSVGEADEVVDLLCESFYAYPVMRFVLGEETDDYAERLRTLIAFFVAARTLRREPMFGVGPPDELLATAIASRPGEGPTPKELEEVRESTWTRLGDAARSRYEAFGNAVGRFVPPEPHLHVNMIGVRRSAQGTGLARILLTHVQELSAGDPNSAGVSGSTEDPRNVPLYEHLGYDVVGYTEVGPGLQSWSFFRPDDA